MTKILGGWKNVTWTLNGNWINTSYLRYVHPTQRHFSHSILSHRLRMRMEVVKEKKMRKYRNQIENETTKAKKKEKKIRVEMKFCENKRADLKGAFIFCTWAYRAKSVLCKVRKRWKCKVNIIIVPVTLMIIDWTSSPSI